ncbi:hypothetical protein SUGI_0483950 [Cryptomeria japonica]|nr:hypothetical protein SUGI_0483950 [Cryptomeria japonica]
MDPDSFSSTFSDLALENAMAACNFAAVLFCFERHFMFTLSLPNRFFNFSKIPENFFNPGKTDSFNFEGPCLKGDVCLLNFMVDGENSWKPRNATVSSKNLSVPYTFHFGGTLPFFT